MARLILILAFALIVWLPLQGRAAEPSATDQTYEQRLALVKRMHEIRPARAQVEAAVNQAAMSLPEMEREPFKEAILEGFDFDRLEALSVNAMVEIFTLQELQRMADFYGSPESASIAQKQPVYEEMVQPEIMKMLDKALMKIRTGAPASENAGKSQGQ